MNTVYKYRGEFERDTKSLLANELFAPDYRSLNDPFECSCEFPPEKMAPDVGNVKRDMFDAGIYSLTKLRVDETFPCNELLWAHYANSHKGFCIEFDLDKLRNTILSDTNIRPIDVKYSKERPILSSEELSDTEIVQQKVFGMKSLPWEYENEIRLIFPNNGFKQYSRNAISKIFFGLNISYKNRQHIIDNITDEQIELFQINRIGNTYALSCGKLSRDDVNKYEIIYEKHNPKVENYYLYYYSDSKDENSLTHLIQTFRKKRGNRPMNLSVYDDKCVIPFIGKYPLSVDEAKIDGKHWIAMSTFDAPELTFMHPGRDY